MSNNWIKSHFRNRGATESPRTVKQRRQSNCRTCRTVATDERGVIVLSDHQKNELYGRYPRAGRRRFSSAAMFSLIEGSELDKLIVAEANTLLASSHPTTSIQSYDTRIFPVFEYNSLGPVTLTKEPHFNVVKTGFMPENIRQGIMKAIYAASVTLNAIERGERKQGAHIYYPCDYNISRSAPVQIPRNWKRLQDVGNNMCIVNRPRSPFLSLNKLMRSTKMGIADDEGLENAFNNGYYQPIYFLVSKHDGNRYWRQQALTYRNSVPEYFRPLPTLDYTPIEIEEISTRDINSTRPRSSLMQSPKWQDDEIPDYIAVKKKSSITYLPARIDQLMQTVTPLPFPINQIPDDMPELYADKHMIAHTFPNNHEEIAMREDNKRLPLPINRTVILMPPIEVRPEEYVSRFGPNLLSTENLLEFIKYLGLDEEILSPPDISGVEIEVLGS